MPKHYCDYCDVWLTHDSAAVRKAHNSGRNHLSNVRDYYASLGHDKAQTIIDQITQAFERGGGPPPGGFNFQFPAPPPGSLPPGAGATAFPGGFPPNMPPFMPPPGMMPPPGAMPPFPPNGAGPGGPPNGFLPFPPDAMNGQKLNGPPPSFVPASSNSGGQGSGPNIHPDRMRMLNGGGM